MGLRPNVVLITAACFTFFLAMPFVQGCFETLMRLKVVPDMQGRIFGFSRMVVMITTTLAYVIGGPLAEYVFEPLMAKDGSLAGSVGNLIEAGPGRGIGLLLIVSGFLILVIAAIGYAYPRVRRVEEELPDVVDETKPVVEAQLTPALA
jgi:uncharacterized membrane protein (DUF485 family)